MSQYFLSLLRMCVVFLINTHVANAEAQEFFQHDQATFACNHTLQKSELKEVQWKINDVICADIFIEGGVNTTVTWNCGLSNRAEMNISHLMISSLETREEGEFQCLVKKGYFSPEEVTRFNVTINVRPVNHTLSLDNNSTGSSCVPGLMVSTIIVNRDDETSTLSCSVDSKPPADITWSIVPDLHKSWQNVTICEAQKDEISHCVNQLTIAHKDDVPATGSLVMTCHVQVRDATSQRCIKLVPLMTTTETVETTTLEITSTISPSTATTSASSAAIENPPTTTISDETTTVILTPRTSTEISLTTQKQRTTSEQRTTMTTKTEITKSSLVPLATSADFHVVVTLPSVDFTKDLLNNHTKQWMDTKRKYCDAMNDTFPDVILDCGVNEFKKGSLLIDSTIKFKVDGLRSMGDVTASLETIVENNIKRSNTNFFKYAKVSAKQLSNTGPTPTKSTPSTPKWKNIYILPIVTGTVVIIMVVVIVLLYNRHSKQRSRNGSHVRKRASRAATEAPALYASISDTPLNKAQQRLNGSPTRQHSTGQGQVNRNKCVTNRTGNPTRWNNVGHDPLSRYPHQTPRRSEPSGWISHNAHRPHRDPHVNRTFQQSYQGYPGMQPVSRAIMPHVARAYNNGYMARNYY